MEIQPDWSDICVCGLKLDFKGQGARCKVCGKKCINKDEVVIKQDDDKE
jgi:hypothetical protein